MEMKKKIIKFLLIALIIAIPIGYYSNQSKVHKVLNVVIEIDRAKNKVLTTKREVDYDVFVDNNKLIEYYKLRDKYNILWATENDANRVNSNVGFTNPKGIILFNRCFVFLTSNSNIIDESVPLKDKTISYNRFVSLRANNGKWYITEDIRNYEDKIGIKDIFDSSYLDKKINEYEAYIKNYNN